MKGKHLRLRRTHAVALVVAGLLIGVTMMATPAMGHVGGTVSHLWGHIKPKADARYLQNPITIINSVNVNSGTFNTLIVNCPAGYKAIGGGVDVNDVDSMFVTSSNPVVNGTRTLLTANGTHGAPNGWMGAATNNEASAMPMKVAVICSK